MAGGRTFPRFLTFNGISEAAVKELRSIVNACFLFLIFLFVYAAVRPGHAVSGIHRPRFLHMQVEDLSGSRPDRVTINVPFGLVGGALRFASLGKVRRGAGPNFEGVLHPPPAPTPPAKVGQ